jgi:hypothetical protein
MRAREAAAARARHAAAAEAATHAEVLQVFQSQRTAEELAADAADDKHDMLTRVAESQQAARARVNKRALREQEQQQRDQAEKVAKLAMKRAADRERKQKLRNDQAFRQLEVRCYLCATTESRMHVCCFRMHHNLRGIVNGAWTLLFGNARSAYRKTQLHR